MFGERNGETLVVYRTAAATADSPSDIGFGLIPVVTVDKTRCRSGVSVPPSVSAMKAFFLSPASNQNPQNSVAGDSRAQFVGAGGIDERSSIMMEDEEETFDGDVVPKCEVKTEEEEEEHGDAWLAESCLETAGVIKKEETVDQDAKEGTDTEEDEEHEGPQRQKKKPNRSKRGKDKEKSRKKTYCKVTLHDCLKGGNDYGFAGNWLRERGSIVLSQKAGNYCQFTCCSCHKKFTSLRAVAAHKREENCCNPIMRISSAEAHVCLICSRVLLNDKKSLHDHYQQSHKKRYLRCLRVLAKDHVSDILSGKTDSVLKLKQSKLMSSPISEKVGNLCTFKCHSCGKYFLSIGNYHRHNNLEKAKGLPPCSRKSLWPDFVEKTVAYRCVLCSELVLCDNSHINQHLTQHSLTLAYYLKKYPDQQQPQSEPESVRLLKEKIPAISTFGHEKVLSPDSIPAEMVTDKVENLCVYKCKCSFISNSYESMRNHGKSCEEETIVHSNVPNFLVEARYHRCRVCAKRVLCDKRFITCHAHAAHFLNHKGYAQLAGSGESVEASKKEEEAIRISKLLDEVPTVEPDKNSMVLPSTLAKDKTTDEVANLCKFRCRAIPSCSFTASSLGSLSYHKRMSHDRAILSYDHSSVVEARYHRCRICSKSILCDRRAIRDHVVSHNVNFKAYEARTCAAKEKSEKGKKLLFPEKAIPAKYITDFVANACAFSCPHCEHRATSLGGIWKHLGRCSGTAGFKPEYVTEARYHKCLVCSRVMLCDNTVISNHLAPCHGLTVKAYMSRTKMKRRPTKAEVEKMLKKVPPDCCYSKRVEKYK